MHDRNEKCHAERELRQQNEPQKFRWIRSLRAIALRGEERSLIKVFVSYSHKDEDLRDALEKHLSLLKNEGLISVWHDHKIGAGTDFAASIDANLTDAQIILLLVSSDFLASSYCWGVELKLAMRLHESRSAIVIPVILRACDWHSAPFGKLLAAPKDGKPIRSWDDVDEALYDVAVRIRTSARVLKLEQPSQIEGLSTSESSGPAKQESQQALQARIFCGRCGASVGSASRCIGTYVGHSFVTYGRHGAYCSRCGGVPGKISRCMGTFLSHNFVNAAE